MIFQRAYDFIQTDITFLIQCRVRSVACADPESCARGGSKFDKFFMREERIQTTKSGPLSSRQRNAIEMTFRRRVDDGTRLVAGLVAL